MLTHVPMGTSEKSRRATFPGRRTQPWAAGDAAFVQSKGLATQAHEIGHFGIFINR